MKIDILLKKFLEEKKEVAESCRVSAKSIDFWEKRAELLFTQMDETEGKFAFSSEEVIEAQCLLDLKEVDFLMKRMKFENEQLDLLERKIEKMEDHISQMLAEHAKEQKK